MHECFPHALEELLLRRAQVRPLRFHEVLTNHIHYPRPDRHRTPPVSQRDDSHRVGLLIDHRIDRGNTVIDLVNIVLERLRTRHLQPVKLAVTLVNLLRGRQNRDF